MSAPNKQYDPVEVTALVRRGGRRAPGTRRWPPSPPRAASTSSRRPGWRTPGTGRRWPLANAEIGALPPAGPGRGGQAGRRRACREVSDALAARQAELEAERDQRVLVEEAVDVTLPWDRQPPRAPGIR